MPIGGQEAPSIEISNLGSNVPIVRSRNKSLADVLIPLPAKTTDIEMTVSNKTLTNPIYN